MPIAFYRPSGEVEARRRLVHRFLALPFRHQFAIVQSLNVLTGQDGTLGDEALFPKAFKRAAAQGLLGKLWEETEKRHPDPAAVNPFEGVVATYSVLEDRLRALGTLKDGWYDGNGKAPSPEGLAWCKGVLQRVLARYPHLALRLYPTPEGGVQVEWTRGTWEASATFDLGARRVFAQAVELEGDGCVEGDETILFDPMWGR